MNAEKKTCTSIIQLDNGSNYAVAESVTMIELLLEDIIPDNSFIPLHFPDGLECKIKKCKIAIFYENTE